MSAYSRRSSQYTYQENGIGFAETPKSESASRWWRSGDMLAQSGTPLPTPDAITRLEVKNSASSVVLAFRELQAKAKQIEHERITASRDVEELRRRLAEEKRNESLLKSRTEIKTTEEILSIRESSEHVLRETTDIQSKFSKLTEYSHNIHRDIATQRAKLQEATEDSSRGAADIKSLEHRCDQMRENLQHCTTRCNELERRLVSITSNNTKLEETEHKIITLQSKIKREQSSTLRSNVRISALQRYFDIILQINNDLTNSLKSREESSNRIFRIVESQSGSLFGTKASQMAEAFRPSNSFQSEYSRNVATSSVSSKFSKKQKVKILDHELLLDKRSKETKRKKNKKVASKVQKVGKRKKHKSVLDSDSEDEYQPKISSMYVDSNYESAVANQLAKQHIYDERRRREGDTTNDTKLTMVHNIREFDRPPLPRHASPGSSREAERRNQSNESLQRVLTKTKSSGIAGNDSAVVDKSSSRSEWLLRPQDREAMLTSTVGEQARSTPERKRGRTDESINRRRNSLSRSRSLSRDSSRGSGIIHTAARLAATATATAIAAATAAEYSSQIGRVFIPSSPSTNREFNVVASVSKAARSARELNATLASKVKSLDFDGAGPLFNEIEHISLQDMHDYLNKIRDARESRTDPNRY